MIFFTAIYIAIMPINWKSMPELSRNGQTISSDDHFTVSAEVVVSPQFFAWVCGFGTAAQIIGPEHVVRKMADHVKGIAAMYD